MYDTNPTILICLIRMLSHILYTYININIYTYITIIDMSYCETFAWIFVCANLGK